jgi:hypothetical protein
VLEKTIELQDKAVELEAGEVNAPSPTIVSLGVNLLYRGSGRHVFSNVDPIYKKPGKNYWNYLTLTAMEVYEKVYDTAKDPNTGLVHCEQP